MEIRDVCFGEFEAKSGWCQDCFHHLACQQTQTEAHKEALKTTKNLLNGKHFGTGEFKIFYEQLCTGIENYYDTKYMKEHGYSNLPKISLIIQKICEESKLPTDMVTQFVMFVMLNPSREMKKINPMNRYDLVDKVELDVLDIKNFVTKNQK